MRREKHNYYLDIAETILERSTCIRRNYGAVIVNNDEIISTGYNGAPRGRANCSDLEYCTRDELQIPIGQRYELCRSVHAEQNAIISAERNKMTGGTLYLVGKENKTGKYTTSNEPCNICKKSIINAGIKQIICRDDKEKYHIIDVNEYIDNDTSLPGVFV